MKSEKSAKIKERELIIKLSNEGKTCREISTSECKKMRKKEHSTEGKWAKGLLNY